MRLEQISELRADAGLFMPGVLVVDDHAAVRNAVQALVDAKAPAMRCVGSAVNGDEALRMARVHQPSCAVVDVELGHEDGLGLLPQLLLAAPCRVVVFTAHPNAAVTARAHALGAHAVISKLDPPHHLLSAIADALTPVSAGVPMSRDANPTNPAVSGCSDAESRSHHA